MRIEVQRGDRTLVVHDDGAGETALLWHIGSPQTGALLAPVLEAARARGIRLISYGRPGYGGSTANRGRDVASAALDVEAIVDHLGVDTFATMGASGGGPHALACAALLPGRVTAVATLASLAHYSSESWWVDGMQAPGGILSALSGRQARASFAETDEFDPEQFIAADLAMFDGPWSTLGEDVAASEQWGDDGLIDDDVAFTKAWGFDPGAVAAPTLLLHGHLDRVVPVAHSEWMARHVPRSELVVHPGDGHIAILREVPAAMDWLLAAQ